MFYVRGARVPPRRERERSSFVQNNNLCETWEIGLAQAGKKVLLTDGDPQGSLTISLVSNCLLIIVTAPVVLVLTLFVLALHGADLHIRFGAWSTKHDGIALLGVAVLITYSPQNGAILLVMAFLISRMGLPLAAIWLLGKAAEFEICDPGLGVWVNDVNIIWNKTSRTMGDETQCPASLFIRNEL